MTKLNHQRILLIAFLLTALPAMIWLASRKSFVLLLTLFVLAVFLFGRLLKLNRRIRLARVLHENALLRSKGARIITHTGRTSSLDEEVIVSASGLMIGKKLFIWDLDGVRDVRLKHVRINRNHLKLTLRKKGEFTSIELIHGIQNEKDLSDLRFTLWNETGVQPVFTIWDDDHQPVRATSRRAAEF